MQAVRCPLVMHEFLQGKKEGGGEREVVEQDGLPLEAHVLKP